MNEPQDVPGELNSVALDVVDRQEKNISASQELRTDLPKDRPLLERIGNVALDTIGGVFSGCKMMTFKDAKTLNTYFRENANVMLVDWKLDGNYGTLYCFVTNTLDAHQLKVIKWRTDAIEKYVQEEKDKDEAERAAAEEQLNKDATEKLRLADVGAHCEKSHGSVIKQMREKNKVKKGKK